MAAGPIRTMHGNPILSVGRRTITFVEFVGDLSCFFGSMVRALCARLPRREVLWPNLHQIGVESIPVVMITGMFIGMVLSVQMYDQLKMMHFESRIGSVINISLVKELGPVLAATMLAGRVGSAMAAQLGTMRVTEQIDALRALGADPIQYLVVPRFLACFLLIPTLTLVADAVGMFGGWLFSTQGLGVPSHEYWLHSTAYVTAYDVMSGVFKSVFFGAAIAVIACHRGFHCGEGAEGVGRAATESFVYSFIAILAIDFVLGVFLSSLYFVIWPGPISL